MASLIEATRAYERWLRSELDVVAPDLALKHRLMAASPFVLMRGTFYRFVPLWQRVCADLAAAPRLLAVGDLHVENFGTWRDSEGRLVWGINDVDEAAPMPYTIDLVRLATSALLARREEHLAIAPKAACKAILEGYAAELARGGRPFVLEESHGRLRDAALSAERDPVRFWKKLTARPVLRAPARVRKLLAARLPDPALKFRVVHRVSGMGSLGRPRYVALARWRDAEVAREAKAMLPSAYGWALGRAEATLHCASILARAVRSPDPFFAFSERWQLRRLGPHCSRIELSALPKKRNEAHLLEAMGRETANLHLGSADAVPTVAADLKRRKKGWLLAAAAAMAEATMADWKTWKARH